MTRNRQTAAHLKTVYHRSATVRYVDTALRDFSPVSVPTFQMVLRYCDKKHQLKKQITMNIAADKLSMYKAVETVCTSNHTKWNDSPEFRGAFSRFAVKVAQLDLLTDTTTNPLRTKSGNPGALNEYMRKLMFEIDKLLSNSIDCLVKFRRSEHNEFYSLYVSARTRC
jgi:hypothetical protein